MSLHETALPALAATVVLALVARAARAVDTSGALAGIFVAGSISAGQGLPGLGLLALFFASGSVATRVGWARKQDEGTAEAGEGARDARRVLAKGGIAALCGLICAAGAGAGAGWAAGALAGALAAATADTLGTEVGTLARGRPRLLPTFRAVPRGTPGAVSWQGTLGGAVGAAALAAVAGAGGVVAWTVAPFTAAAGIAGSFLESAAGALPAVREGVPGWVRNLFATGSGALLGGLAARSLS